MRNASSQTLELHSRPINALDLIIEIVFLKHFDSTLAKKVNNSTGSTVPRQANQN